ncbi:PD-(D/E)XK nuclease family protein [Desulforamulus hydrothermalis]|uniref:PD-(D/E)XK nuclease family protein n=1 Tax=Desulforamulus hydrothermalis TaxID=412895 RepID=UPI0002EA3BDB|nr:hypothetical protein [Desulforamulus hydrothermalis]SHG75009.1 hypothetical protein SAMN02745177_00246 [Desulforamulus hydrothermalis Lam5 = DSM 18033]
MLALLPVDLLIIGMIAGALIIYNIIKRWQSFRARHRVRQAGKAEAAAGRLLETAGYRILAVQERVPVVTKINGKPHKSHIQADFIVQKGKQVFVVDVKTGEAAQKPAAPENRRQLLEYYLVYRPDGVLVLDMDKLKLYHLEFEVEFPSPRGVSPVPCILSFCAGILAALLIIKGGKIS